MGPDDVAAAIGTNIAVGVLVLLTALLAAPRSRTTAVLLAGVAAAWFAGFFWPLALFWHRAPLVHVILAFPRLRPRGSIATGVVAATYGVSVLAPVLWQDDRATLLLAGALLTAAAWSLHDTHGVEWRRRRWAMLAAGVFSGVLVAVAVVRLTVGGSVDLLTLVAYDTGIVAVGLVLLLAVQEVSARRIADLVVDLGEHHQGGLAQALGGALGDPDLRVGWWRRASGRYTDPHGIPVADHAPPGRVVTRLDREGEPFLLLEHDEALVGDARLEAALQAAGRLTAANVAWHAEVAARVADLEDSRRRLVGAGDEERRRLAEELDRDVVDRLEDLGRLLDGADRCPGAGAAPGKVPGKVPGKASGNAPGDVPGDDADDHLAHAVRLLHGTMDDLRQLAAGLRPRSLEGGLEGALLELAESAPVPVQVEVNVGKLSEEVELTAYFVCAEALSNVTKYADGSAAEICVGTKAGLLSVRVVDRGPGGAEMVERGGLRGLRDRVAALGGVLGVESDGSGTRVSAELPLADRSLS